MWSIFHDRLLECIIIEITLNNSNKFIFGSVYRPGTNHPTLSQNNQFNQSLELIDSIISLCNEKKIPTFLFGDFNIDVLKYGQNNQASEYVDLLFSHGFLQTITKPTRCTNSTATLIDHCLTNSTNFNHNSSILTSLLSDHFPIIYRIKQLTKKLSPVFVEYRDLSDENISKFLNNFSNLTWEPFYNLNCAQMAYNEFSTNFFSLYDMHFPVIKKKFNPKYHKQDPWFTKGLLISRRTKLKLDKIASRSRKSNDIEKYKKYRNVYNKVVRSAKKAYYDVMFVNAQSDMKKTWSLIRCAINRKQKSKTGSISNLLSNGILLSNPKDIANEFNKFFVTTPLLISQTLPRSDTDYNEEQLNNPAFTFDGNPISEEEIFTALSLLSPKKFLDYNNVSLFFIKKCINRIVNQLKHVFNLSIISGVVPSQFKIAKVVLVFKNGDPRLPDNYRPIALISNFSKILEKIIHIRLYNYLDHFNIISPSQFGFRPAHSTIHPMILFNNYISKAFNEKNMLFLYFVTYVKRLIQLIMKYLLKNYTNLVSEIPLFHGSKII